MFEELDAYVQTLIQDYGNIGILLGMFLESSIVPVPSELVLVSAGALGIPLTSIVVFGSIGSVLGSIIGYSIGRFGGRPFMERYGKYLLITEAKLLTAETWVKKYGNITVFVSRLIPFVPFKVFSISAGILRMDVPPFLLYTFLGMIPRSFILAYLGKTIITYKIPGLIAIIIAGIIIYLAYKKFRHDAAS
jgi:membrane protein DedA with SNARE-associated domain